MDSELIVGRAVCVGEAIVHIYPMPMFMNFRRRSRTGPFESLFYLPKRIVISILAKKSP